MALACEENFPRNSNIQKNKLKIQFKYCIFNEKRGISQQKKGGETQKKRGRLCTQSF